jgi:hypothetical protein
MVSSAQGLLKPVMHIGILVVFFPFMPALYFLLGRKPDLSVNAGAPSAGNVSIN